MTEPDVASSDARNIRTSIVKAPTGDYVVTGRKWWSSGAMHPHCTVLLVMGQTDTEGPQYRRPTIVDLRHESILIRTNPRRGDFP